MNVRVVAMILLILGIGLAASNASRYGDDHAAYRAAESRVMHMQTQINDGASELTDELSEAKQQLAALALPAPKLRLMQWLKVGGPGWALGILLIAFGAFLARQQQALENKGGAVGADGQVDFLVTVRRIADRLAVVSNNIHTLPMDTDAPEAREEIDAVAVDLIQPLIDARGRFIARHGLATFAEYFSAFAAGERYLARCWSALTDGHAVEARKSLDRCLSNFDQAEQLWIRVERDY